MLSQGALQQMVEQNDQKHDAAHRRLREDLTEGFNDLGKEIDVVKSAQAMDHEEIVVNRRLVEANKERRKDLSGYKVVILAAGITGVFRILEVVVTAIVKGHL